MDENDDTDSVDDDVSDNDDCDTEWGELDEWEWEL